MRSSAWILVSIAFAASCSDDPADAETMALEGEFAGIAAVHEDYGVEVALTNATLNGEPTEEPLSVIVSGDFRDFWGHSYEPEEIAIGTPVHGRAESCFVTDALRCGADELILDLPIAATD